MSRILLVIGLASAKSAATPELVYLGRSGEEMRAAIAAATHPRLIIVPHVQGIPKNNSRAATNQQTAAAEVALAEEQETAELAGLRERLALAEEAHRVVVAQRDAAQAALAALKTVPPAALEGSTAAAVAPEEAPRRRK